jgi:ParB/RepB/Spo0J family partition protein
MPRDRKTSRTPINTSRLFNSSAEAGSSDLDYLLAGEAGETMLRAQARGLPVVQLPVETVAPDPHQLRRMPQPDELRRLIAQGTGGAETLMASLQALGQSIQEMGQIQPVIVYRDTDPDQPKVTHRLLHGQRRWTASVIMGLATIWAVEVARPSETERLQRQFDENEQREDFTDMERAWAITALREALSTEQQREVSWVEVEARLKLSESRRRDLLRLLRFTPEGQEIILRHRWSEWTLRPLHMALSAGELQPHTATSILTVLTQEPEVTAPIVAAIVADTNTQLAASPDTSSEQQIAEAQLAPRKIRTPNLVTHLKKARRGMDEVYSQVQAGLDGQTRAALMSEAVALMQSLEQLIHSLDQLPDTAHK